ncbi:hypothetical protein C8E97_3695 [Saccharothrix australiensis]|uniref:Uncharacterized protein n=1 Tax=Saccharothrix australiensis TaxID=2072 RepID=A0A495W0P4_9PSEU|nr:hypothetical protein C8E97_3695 [Saccharothrix australiensis]
MAAGEHVDAGPDRPVADRPVPAGAVGTRSVGAGSVPAGTACAGGTGAEAGGLRVASGGARPDVPRSGGALPGALPRFPGVAPAADVVRTEAA